MRPLARELARWTLGSGLIFASGLGTSVLLHEVLGVPTTAAVATAYVVSMIVSFTVQRHLIFPAAATRDVRRQAAAFVLTSLLFRATEYALFLVLHHGLGLIYLLAQLAVAAVSFVGKFFFYRRHVFGKASVTSPPRPSG